MSRSQSSLFRNVLLSYFLCALLALVLSFASVPDLVHSAYARSLLVQISAYLFILYLCGSIPFGLIFTKILMNQDVRDVGSGNIGMTNVMRTGSKVAGLLTLICDVLKGVIPLMLLQPHVDSMFVSHLYYFTFLVPVLGHMFPCWLDFKGGKGIATGFGVMLFFFWPLALMTVGAWVIIARLTKMSSLAGLVTFGLFPFAVWYFTTISAAAWTFCLAGLVFFAHRDNIRRLLSGQESKFGDPTI